MSSPRATTPRWTQQTMDKLEYKETRIPAIFNEDRKTWASVKIIDGLIVDLPEEEATHDLVRAFWIEKR
jgi:hypothetical protein